MKPSDALRVLAELSSSQWGMVTSAQASMRGVTRLNLSRLAEAGHLVRLTHGVYRDAGAPSDEFEDLRAAWLSTTPDKLAEERLADVAGGVVIAGASAARLHGVGDLPADHHEFSSPARRQSQRSEIRYRQLVLDAQDVTIAAGLPVTTIERTIADLVEARTDLSLVADALRDAAKKRRLDANRLEELLSPLAARRGFRKGDGAALLNRLLEVAGIDIKSLAEGIAAAPTLGALVTVNYLGRHGQADIARLLVTPEMKRAMRPISESFSKSLMASLRPQLDATSTAAMASIMKNSGMDRALREAMAPAMAQLAGSDAFRSLSKNWAQSMGTAALPSFDIGALTQAARQLANDD